MQTVLPLLKSICRRLRCRALLRTFRRTAHSPRLFGDRYICEDNTQVVLYTDRADLFPDYRPRRSLRETAHRRACKISLVVTARNEAEVARQLISDLQQQVRLPDELIVVDTGSSDGTLELLRQLAPESRIPMRVLSKPGGNIACGRNTGIRAARYPYIAVTDFGCHIPPRWLESLAAPFEDDPDIQVVAGRYDAVNPDGQPVNWLLGASLHQIDPQTHLPSGVSVAFRKDAWERVGGYPEWLTLTGEDTYFALELKRTTTRWAFVPEAAVRWVAPTTFRQYIQKAYRWSIGNGEAGMYAYVYRYLAYRGLQILKKLIFVAFIPGLLLSWIFCCGSLHFRTVALVLIAALLMGGAVYLWPRRAAVREQLLRGAIHVGEMLGFLRGMYNRPKVDLRRQKTLRGIFFILAGVPIDDTGGGARWTQIALELLRRQYLVIFLSRFPKYENTELHLQIRHPNLITKNVRSFSWNAFHQAYSQVLGRVPLFALVELPLPDFLPLLEQVRSENGRIIYDLLDNWESSLGGDWYSESTEDAIIAQSHHLVATAPPLAAALEARSGRPVRLLPNAVNGYLFNSERIYQRPADLPVADWTLIYIGALWGEWFDWDLLVDLAKAYPKAAVVVIGDYAGQCANPPPNLHFLGLKPQRVLPAYLNFANVALVPWRVSEITQATSPLKVYEYLAMHVPVVAPDLTPLRDLPGVFLAQNREHFIELAAQVRKLTLPQAEIDAFIARNTWKARVDTLLHLDD